MYMRHRLLLPRRTLLLTNDCLLLSTYHLLLTSYFSLLTTHYLLLTTYYLLLTTYYLLLTPPGRCPGSEADTQFGGALPIIVPVGDQTVARRTKVNVTTVEEAAVAGYIGSR